jgi:hypothetical protein
MTVRELSERMDSRELSEWIAYTRYFQALPDEWRQAGLIASAVLAPHSSKGKAPRISDFVPIDTPPQHPEQTRAEIQKLMDFFRE